MCIKEEYLPPQMGSSALLHFSSHGFQQHLQSDTFLGVLDA